MLKSNGFRIFLLFILIGGVAAIVWSYRARTSERIESTEKSLLSPEITRQSTEFEYTQLREGRTQFRVTAESSTLTREGTHRLKGARLYRYGTENTPTDAVASDLAIYRPEAKEIEFQGDVLIELVDGTRVFAEWAGGDLARETVMIRDRFEFRRGEVYGEGEGLLYRIEQRELEIDRSFQAWVPTQSDGVFTARSGKVTYWLSEGRASLFGGVEIFSELYSLSAGRVLVSMDENRNVSLLNAREQARLKLAETRTFSGAEIVLRPQGEEYLLQVDSRLDGGLTSEMASYKESGEEGEHSLEAVSITTEFLRVEGASEDAPSFLISSLDATGDVLFRSSSQGIEDGRAGRFEAVFDEGGTRFRRVNLIDDVRLIKSSSTNGDSQSEEIRAGRLRIDFSESGSMDSMTAESEVEILVEDAEQQRELSAERVVNLSYKEGALAGLEAEGSCRLLESSGDESRSIEAPSISATFEEGQLSALTASQGVSLTFRGDQGLRESRSKELSIEYTAGNMVEAVQTGQVRMWRSSDNGRIEISSERADYVGARGEMRFSGGRPLLKTYSSEDTESRVRQTETRAEEFLLDENEGRLMASGSVQSAVVLEQGPAVVSSQRMETTFDGVWIEYGGRSQLIQGENLLAAQIIRINPKNEALSASGGVRNILVAQEQNETRTYEVTSKEMKFDAGKHQAIYSGDAVLLTEELKLSAPLIEVKFSSSVQESLEQVEASGGVEIVENGRKWTADKATYFSADQRVVVSDQ